MAHPPAHMSCLHYIREGVGMHFTYFTYERLSRLGVIYVPLQAQERVEVVLLRARASSREHSSFKCCEPAFDCVSRYDWRLFGVCFGALRVRPLPIERARACVLSRAMTAADERTSPV
ncbi:hypothetical protein EVAR_24720_1 [Eumeta japonica]|uniref:Uncharacterized protein n=1 Tax=Eumeta variegata TaxID=151549 RepID=A0A4C1VEP9_EUMVA|nr:hypothetical protein EVAR_24720_1 [Eumeta japonica]